MEYHIIKNNMLKNIFECVQRYDILCIEYTINDEFIKWINDTKLSVKLSYHIKIEIGKDKFTDSKGECDVLGSSLFIQPGDIILELKLLFESQEDYNLFKLSWS